MGNHVNENAPRKYSIGQMWDVHREIMRLAITGMKHTEIAYELNVSEAMVSYTLNSPIVKRQMDNMRAARDMDSVDVGKRISELAVRAVEVMGELIDDPLPNIQLGAAKDILDRAGFAPIRTLRTENTSVHFTADEIMSIKQRAREIGLVYDLEPMKEVTSG